MMELDTTPFDLARQDIRDLLTVPLRRWMATPPAVRRDAMFVRLLSLPLDLGAAGFEVTITQGERGWSVEAKKD
ncbi:MAG TPA: hypothetical protein VNZ58_07225, partial [Thermomicrobiales bacterium]|nr:hypothetical protein [Thermomicrobiales bacterium]